MNNKLFFIILFIVFIFAGASTFICLADNIEVKGSKSIATHSEQQEKLVPDHEIKYEDNLSPDWKDTWDIARSLYHEKKYPEALVQYEILFTQKDNIDEARWEYASILMFLERWENAKTELEKLLVAEPESFRFQTAMADVCLKSDDLGNAIDLYTKLLGQHLTEAEKILVLEGLISAHEIKGNKVQVLPLLNQLVAIKPQNPDLLMKLATLELDLGNTQRAWELGVALEKSLPLDAKVLTLIARVEESRKGPALAATYWQKVIGADPESVTAHEHLYAYYYDNENWAMSFSHLEPLIKATPNNVELLEKAAELNMRLDRIDRALEYYEFALAIDPLHARILKGKKTAQKKLAGELLALVEVEETKRVWQDLVKVAPDRIGVYREIANLLREQNKVDELIQVLQQLNNQVPGDRQVYDELATLLKKKGREDELNTLKAVKPDPRDTKKY